MSISLSSYRVLTSLLEPLSGVALSRRLASGKERSDRIGERRGLASAPRPDGRLIWLHGASVGETALLLDLFARLRARLPGLSALVTSHTLTSADMIAARAAPGVIHQMAPIDAPGAVGRFLDHWAPDAGVFAEGEIWPNLIFGAREHGVPLALVNARMTARSLAGWRKRASAAKELFGAFSFIGAADSLTASGIGAASGRTIDVIGNLKRAAAAPSSPPDIVAEWERAITRRPVLLAASTHPGEEDFVLDALSAVTRVGGEPLLILVPRHPDRAPDIVAMLKERNIAFKQRSTDGSPGCEGPVLLADTIGEMGLWLALCDAVYLGGATAEGVGGHNPIEPLKLEKPVFTGPHAFNFSDLMRDLSSTHAVAIGETSAALAAFFQPFVHGGAMIAPDWAAVRAIFDAVDATLDATLEAVETMIGESAHA